MMARRCGNAQAWVLSTIMGIGCRDLRRKTEEDNHFVNLISESISLFTSSGVSQMSFTARLAMQRRVDPERVLALVASSR